MQVGAVAGLVGDGLGGQGRPQGQALGDPADGLAVEDHVVGRPQRGRVPYGQLLLAVAQLRVVVLDPQALRLQGADQLDRVVVGGVEAGAGEAQAVVERDQPVRPADRSPGSAGRA